MHTCAHTYICMYVHTYTHTHACTGTLWVFLAFSISLNKSVYSLFLKNVFCFSECAESSVAAIDGTMWHSSTYGAELARCGLPWVLTVARYATCLYNSVHDLLVFLLRQMFSLPTLPWNALSDKVDGSMTIRRSTNLEGEGVSSVPQQKWRVLWPSGQALWLWEKKTLKTWVQKYINRISQLCKT